MSNLATRFDEAAMMCRRKAPMYEVSIRLCRFLGEPIIRPEWRDYDVVYDQLWQCLSYCYRTLVHVTHAKRAADIIRKCGIQAGLALEHYQQPTWRLRYQVMHRVYLTSVRLIEGG